MKKILTASVVALFMLTVIPSAQAVNPLPPAEWKMPATSKYMKYKGMDCWKWWRITKCLPK